MNPLEIEYKETPGADWKRGQLLQFVSVNDRNAKGYDIVAVVEADGQIFPVSCGLGQIKLFTTRINKK